MLITRITKYHKNSLFRLLMVLVATCGLSSCVNDDLFLSSLDDDDSDNVKIRGVVLPTGETRAFYGSSNEVENVTSGKWYFTYPKESNLSFGNALYGTATVDFDASIDDPTAGFAKYLNANGEYKDLKWKHIWGNGNASSSYYYYLHNILPEYYEETYNDSTSTKRTQSYQKISFNDASPFKKILPLDKVNGTNDIITGYISMTGSSKNKDLNFELSHRMALFKLNIEVYAAQDNFRIKLDRATVKMNNLYTGISSFSINSPSTFYTSSSSSSSLQYGNYVSSIRGEFTIRGSGDDNPEWESTETIGDYEYDGEVYHKDIYHSLEFVVPPQSLGTSLPKITITVPKEDVTGSRDDIGKFVEYTGIIPSSMFNVKNPATGELDPAPIATTFTSGYQLTVTATIDSPETELHFSPVKVEAWLSKGTFTISTNQAGMYNIDDFEKMVRAFNEGNLVELEKYGYQTSDGTYILQFWNNVELPESFVDGTPIKGCMKDSQIKFAFMFNGNVVKYFDQAGEEKDLENSVGQLELYNLVTGKDVNYTGVRTMRDFLSVIAICEEEITPDIAKLLPYGTLSNSDNVFILDISDSFNVDVGDIFQKMPAYFGGYNVDFEFRNNAVINVLFPDVDNVKMTVNGNSNLIEFKKLIFKSEYTGISDFDDFRALKLYYNNYYRYYPDLLSLFGTKSETSEDWTFSIINDITMQGEEFFLSMIPDPENGKPNFSMSLRKTTSSSNYYIVTVADEFTPCTLPNSTSSPNYCLSMIQGGRTSNNPLGTIVSYYNNTTVSTRNYMLWYYGGRFDRNQKKWIFPLYYASPSSSTYTAIWSNVFGQMIPDEAAGKYDYEFDFTGLTTNFEVRTAPVIENPGTTQTLYLSPDAEGQEMLKHITLGDYWEWLESTGKND